MSPGKNAGRKKTGKAASIYDVARESGVSVFTVSAVVNNKSHVGKGLRERVEAAIRKLNYRPNLIARSLANQRTHTIGMIVPDIGNPFFPLVVRGAEDAAQKHGYNLLLCNSDDSLDKEEKAIELLLSKRVDGILLTKAAGDFRPQLRQMIKEVDTPFVLVMRTYPKLTKDAVLTDDYHGAYEAVSHLARAGRKRIALISGPLKVSNAKERWQGFHDALKAEGLPYEEDLVIEGDYRLESGFRAGHSLFSRRPDGIYVANHLMTIGLLQAAEEMGLRCPEDFGLVSFDDYPWLGIFRPRLTTVELPKHQLGTEAAELLIKRITGDDSKPVVRKLQPELRIRESCGFGLRAAGEEKKQEKD
ncbi:MAG TPA: LacI family DNA-binding transcriptional regulator [Candidatus Acidoferrum sp.]|jgi:LacI family transcriptional regulator|nr:LacI family DNA-binding transcriptional regulator [Candidatus Acidoferrum sp.]